MTVQERHIGDTIAFLLARIQGNPDAAIAILNGQKEFQGPNLLMGMTDLAMAMASTLSIDGGNDDGGVGTDDGDGG